MEILFLIGISGAGKSTFSTKFLKEHPNHVRINYDSIRTMLLPGFYPGKAYYDRKDMFKIEKLVVQIAENAAVLAVHNDKKNLLIDNTNLKLSYIENWINKIDPDDFKFKFFDLPVGQAKWRVYARDRCSYLTSKETILTHIDKQAEQYEIIKRIILEKWPERVMT